MLPPNRMQIRTVQKNMNMITIKKKKLWADLNHLPTSVLCTDALVREERDQLFYRDTTK